MTHRVGQTDGARANLVRLLKFGVLGALGFGINIAVTVVLTEVLGASEELAFAIALAVWAARMFPW